MTVLYCGREARATLVTMGGRAHVRIECAPVDALISPPAPGLLVLEATTAELGGLSAAGFTPFVAIERECGPVVGGELTTG